MSSSPAPFPTPSGLLEYELPNANLMRDLRRIFDEALANHPVNLNSSVRTDNLVQEILSLEILYLHATNDYHESRARWFRYRDFSDILIEKARKTTYPNSRILVDALERLKESDEEMLSSLFGRMLDAWIAQLTAVGISFSPFALWQLRTALEQNGEFDETAVVVAAEWIKYAGKVLWKECQWTIDLPEWLKDEYRVEPAFQGEPRFSKQRWGFWKKRFGENKGEEARCAVELMDGVENKGKDA